MARKQTLAALRKKAGKMKIVGRSKMNRAQLERAIEAGKDSRQIPNKGPYSRARDAQRRAKPPGKRFGPAGNIYYERRRNRSDVDRKQMLGANYGDDEVVNLANLKLDAMQAAADAEKYGESKSDAVFYWIDGNVIYSKDAWDLAYALSSYMGDWDKNELGIEIKDIHQLAYVSLYTFLIDTVPEVFED